MHRRNLILRRFGPLSFGLGYFQDGVWVDHLAPNGATVKDQANGSTTESDLAMDIVHQWYDCCSDLDGDEAAPAPTSSGRNDGEISSSLRLVAGPAPTQASRK